jgi:glutaredoxin
MQRTLTTPAGGCEKARGEGMMGFSGLFSWWRRWRLDHLHFVVYTRPGCHLCEVAWDQLRRERRRYGFRLAAVNVDTDPTLAERYGTCVPVVTVNGKVRFRGVVNPVLLRRLLRASASGAA